MTLTIETLCTTLQINPEHGDEEQLRVLQQWCQAHISQDLRFYGNTEENYQWYMELATHYLQYFLANIPSDPNCIDENVPALKNMNAVQYAAAHGYDRYLAALSLLSHDVLNTPNSAGMRPLHLAAENGHLQTVEALLALGADPNLKNRQSELPLHCAVSVPQRYTTSLIASKEAIYRALLPVTLEAMAQQDNQGDTVLNVMARAGMGSALFSDLVEALLLHDVAPASCKNNQTHYPIHTAILHDKAAIVMALLTVPGVSRLDDQEGRVALHYAAQYGVPLAVFEQCIAMTSDINCRDRADKTPLMVAAEAKNIPAMAILIRHGADATLIDEEGHSILDYALHDHDDVLKTWILENTNLISRDVLGREQPGQIQG